MVTEHAPCFKTVLLCTLMWAGVSNAYANSPKSTDTFKPGSVAPTPADPYPIAAAGWGPASGGGFASRWAEDWSGMRAAGRAPALKAIPIGEQASLTVSAEARLRFDAHRHGQATFDNDYEQTLLRGIVGADLRFNPQLRIYGEIGTGQVAGRRTSAAANFQNKASIQQLFVEGRGTLGGHLVGAMYGRQQFGDGPKQLISIGDGANLHRTWNGARVYLHGTRARIGAFSFRGTRPGKGYFDERINGGERLHGINGSLTFAGPGGGHGFLEPFWYHSENASGRAAGRTGHDERDTVGARLWGRYGEVRYDWTVARQTGKFGARDVDAWALFASQNLALSEQGWKPQLSATLDVASGGGSYGSGPIRAFNHLYAASSYLGEGQFLSLSNLVRFAPGITVSPSKQTTLTVDYGYARRLRDDDAAYAGGMKPYAATVGMRGHTLGGVARVVGTWKVNKHVTLALNLEHLNTGDLLERAKVPAATYLYAGATFRY